MGIWRHSDGGSTGRWRFWCCTGIVLYEYECFTCAYLLDVAAMYDASGSSEGLMIPLFCLWMFYPCSPWPVPSWWLRSRGNQRSTPFRGGSNSAWVYPLIIHDSTICCVRLQLYESFSQTLASLTYLARRNLSLFGPTHTKHLADPPRSGELSLRHGSRFPLLTAYITPTASTSVALVLLSLFDSAGLSSSSPGLKIATAASCAGCSPNNESRHRFQ